MSDPAQTIRESLNDAVRYALGHAINVIDDYANATPPARPFCDDLTTILRNHSAGIGAQQEETR
jgi:hypothetical protein